MAECVICQEPSTQDVMGYPFCDKHAPSLVVGGGQVVIRAPIVSTDDDEHTA